MDSELLFPKMPSVRTARCFFALAIVLSTLSGATQGNIFCDMAAAVTGTIALLSLPKPGIGRFIRNSLLICAASIAGAEAIIWFFDGKPAFYGVAAITPGLCCLALSLCVYKIRSRSLSVTLTTLILLAVAILSTLGAYADSLESLSAFAPGDILVDFDQNLREMMNQAITLQTEAGVAPILDDATVDRTVRIMEFLFPFLLYLFYELAAYMITGLIRRILLAYTLGRRSLAGWLLSPSNAACICYMIASVLCVVTVNFLFSDSSTTGMGIGSILCLSSIAILILTVVGCFAVGVRRTLNLIRIRKRVGIFGILLACVVGMFVPFFIFFYFAFAGAYHQVFDPIIAKHMQNFPPYKDGDS